MSELSDVRQILEDTQQSVGILSGQFPPVVDSIANVGKDVDKLLTLVQQGGTPDAALVAEIKERALAIKTGLAGISDQVSNLGTAAAEAAGKFDSEA